MTARVIQQQVELLDGITMLDSCSIVQREKAKKFLKKQQKQYRLAKNI
jgi:peptide deformylase